MLELSKNENFIKLVYACVKTTIVVIAFINKLKVISLYKYTLSTCT